MIMAMYLDYRDIFWLVLGSLVGPLYLIACILSIIKAYQDRKAIKARIEARRLKAPAPGPPSPVDIIAQEVRQNRWHKRQSSITVGGLQNLLKVHDISNNKRENADDWRTERNETCRGEKQVEMSSRRQQ